MVFNLFVDVVQHLAHIDSVLDCFFRFCQGPLKTQHADLARDIALDASSTVPRWTLIPVAIVIGTRGVWLGVSSVDRVSGCWDLKRFFFTLPGSSASEMFVPSSFLSIIV